MDGPAWEGRGVGALPRHLRGFAQTHLALRRDSRRLVAAVPLLTSSGLPAVAEWWRQFRGIVDWHHRTEDEILWPGLIEHAPRSPPDRTSWSRTTWPSTTPCSG